VTRPAQDSKPVLVCRVGKHGQVADIDRLELQVQVTVDRLQCDDLRIELLLDDAVDVRQLPPLGVDLPVVRIALPNRPRVTSGHRLDQPPRAHSRPVGVLGGSVLEEKEVHPGLEPAAAPQRVPQSTSHPVGQRPSSGGVVRLMIER
jgi:hypothetical protein